MPSVYRVNRVVPVSQKIMLRVIGDVAKYPEFVPFCVGSTISQTTPQGVPEKATLRVGWNGYKDDFESLLRYGPDTVQARAGDSAMFEKLECNWSVKPISEHKCSAALNLEFRFANSLYNIVSGQAGPTVAKRMIQAFEKRALEVAKGAR